MADKIEDDITAPLINKEEEEKNKDEKKSDKKNSEKENETHEEEEENEEERKERMKRLKELRQKILKKNKLTGKVFLVFFLQSLIIFIFIYYAFYSEAFRNLLQKNHKLFFISLVLAAVIMFASEKIKFLSVVPFNYFIFLIFSLCISILVGKLVILFSFKTIAILWVLLVFMILSLSIYAFITKIEIKLLPTSFFVLMVLLIVGVFIKFFAGVSFVDMLFIILCLICFNLYLIYDTNVLIEERKMTSRDYFTLNILLYLDIIMNFIKLAKFIIKNLQSEEGENNKNESLEKIKDFAEDIEQGLDAVKNFGKEEDDDDGDDDGDDDDDDEEEEKEDKKKKKKEKKGKKDDKKDKKKEHKKDKKDDKKEKKKKEDKKDDKKEKKKKDDKKEKKEDKKDKKDKDKKDKDKKGKKDKKKKKKSDDDDEDDEKDNLFKSKEGADFAKNLLGNLFG